MGYNPKDFYFKKAKEKNFAARSVFKLEELDQRFKIFKPGQKVLDLGCAPGSWMQYASQRIGQQGFAIGIDLQKVSLAMTNAEFIQGDAFEESFVAEQAAKHRIELFDVVLSDMAPKTTGIRDQDQQRSYDLCIRALDVARRWLRPGGIFVVKFFQSGLFEDYLRELKPLFMKTELVRPKSTRKASYEIYVIGLKMQQARPTAPKI